MWRSRKCTGVWQPKSTWVFFRVQGSGSTRVLGFGGQRQAGRQAGTCTCTCIQRACVTAPFCMQMLRNALGGHLASCPSCRSPARLALLPYIANRGPPPPRPAPSCPVGCGGSHLEGARHCGHNRVDVLRRRGRRQAQQAHQQGLPLHRLRKGCQAGVGVGHERLWAGFRRRVSGFGGVRLVWKHGQGCQAGLGVGRPRTPLQAGRRGGRRVRR